MLTNKQFLNYLLFSHSKILFSNLQVNLVLLQGTPETETNDMSFDVLDLIFHRQWIIRGE
jgi:hypothetical protein